MSIDSLLTIRSNLKIVLHDIENIILKDLTLWQSKATNGFKIEAIKQYAKENNCTLKDAKDIIDAFTKSNE